MVPSNHRVAVIYKPLPDYPGFGGFLVRGLKQICQVEHFTTGEEVAGFDDYFYVDDGPTDYMRPKFRPATYFAFDMVVPPPWFTQSPALYIERMENFDHSVVFTVPVFEYSREFNLSIKLTGFAADPDFHRPHDDIPRDLDWVAVWHNCGDRIAAVEAAQKRFPNGAVMWRGDEVYAESISRGKCALNWLRAEMVNMRVLEVMAVGTPLVTMRHADMLSIYGFVEGEHYLGFEGVDEMLDQIAWVQENQGEAMAMAQRARKFVLECHTYFHRDVEVLDWIHSGRFVWHTGRDVGVVDFVQGID